MDDLISSAAEQVANLIKETVTALAAGEAKPREGVARKTDLFFPDGIADIHVKLSAPGGISIEIGIASSVPKAPAAFEERPSRITASAHPMFIHVAGGQPVWAKFAEAENGPFGATVKLAVNGQILTDIPKSPEDIR
jgi:hypothetical protein